MGHAIRLQLIGRVTHYVGWIALVCKGLAHLNIARTLFLAVLWASSRSPTAGRTGSLVMQQSGPN
jgi:hypothetical protein